MTNETRNTNIRYAVLLATTLTSFMLYLDRVCMGTILASDPFARDSILSSKDEQATILSAFFWVYALMQVPAGFISDRFGARGALTLYVALWSIFTIFTGFSGGFWALLIARFGVGAAQAGAYPTSVGLLAHWIPFSIRGFASSVVATGGRIGGALAPLITAGIMAMTDRWQPALYLYGIVGLFVAALFWCVFRHTPNDHPWVNPAEIALINEGRPQSEIRARASSHGLPWIPLVTNFSMWMNCLIQFCTNVGWVFVVGQLPRYFKDVHGLSDLQTAQINTVVLLVGMVGMLMGGWITDAATRRWGTRWGRAMPVAGARLLSTLAYVACLWLNDPWMIAAAVAVVAFSTDLGVGGVWAYTQDVGGKYTGSILGWGNMWGNIGAAVSPALANWILRHFDANQDWNEVFIAFAVAFFISTLAALGLDATKPIVPREPKTA